MVWFLAPEVRDEGRLIRARKPPSEGILERTSVFSDLCIVYCRQLGYAYFPESIARDEHSFAGWN